MTEETQVLIQTIDDKSPHLQTVIALGDANKATLGFLSEGTFLEHAASRQIIIALSPQEGCIGYLLYGVTKSYNQNNRVTLKHLCISASHQGKGITKKLVEHLKQITKDYSGIGLTCRRDYQLEKMWSKLGFVAQHDKSARTIGKELTYWWLDHGHATLFSIGLNQQLETKLCVVIDANIFFDLCQAEIGEVEESQALLADWVQAEIYLCLTDEIKNRIHVISDKNERKRQQIYAQNFTFLPCTNKKLEEIVQKLQTFFAQHEITCNESNLRYLARTIAADAQIFVTRDPILLQLADEIYTNFRLSISTATSLINGLDDLRRNLEYQPVRLAGTLLKQIRIQSVKDNILNEYFQSEEQGETKAKFQQNLRRFLTETDKFECSVVFEGENQPLALVVYDRHKQHELEIPMFRVAKNTLAVTIAHHLLFQISTLAACEKRQFTRINDPHLQEVVTTAIQKDPFVKVKDGWLRANIAMAETASQLSIYLNDLASNLGNEYNFCHQIAKSLNTDSELTDIKAMWDIERYIFPAKIIDADIPTFIISIKPFWAHQLFDAKLANQTIIGATKTELALNREAVYYKSKQAPKKLHPGVNGRILWYVSADKYRNRGYSGVSAIRACSRLDEVFIGKPKELYRRFRDLGIYEEKNVFDVADNNLEKDIMALRFSDTELFNKFIPLTKIQEVLCSQSTMQGTCYISAKNFAKIYTLGTHT